MDEFEDAVRTLADGLDGMDDDSRDNVVALATAWSSGLALGIVCGMDMARPFSGVSRAERKAIRDASEQVLADENVRYLNSLMAVTSGAVGTYMQDSELSDYIDSILDGMEE